MMIEIAIENYQLKINQRKIKDEIASLKIQKLFHCSNYSYLFQICLRFLEQALIQFYGFMKLSHQ